MPFGEGLPPSPHLVFGALEHPGDHGDGSPIGHCGAQDPVIGVAPCPGRSRGVADQAGAAAPGPLEAGAHHPPGLVAGGAGLGLPVARAGQFGSAWTR